MERRDRRKAEAAAATAKKSATRQRSDHKNKQPSDVGKKDVKAASKKKRANDDKRCGDMDKLQAMMVALTFSSVNSESCFESGECQHAC